MIIPGFVISIVTFPGVIVHELAHQLFCRWARVAVFDVCYFRVGNPAGYVIHEIPRTSVQHVLIGLGPFFVNTILGALIAFPAAIPVLNFNLLDPLNAFLVWLSVSVAMHAFPSTGDARGIWSALFRRSCPWWLRVLGAPVVGLIWVGALGSMFWLDALYGIGVAIALPNLLVGLAV